MNRNAIPPCLAALALEIVPLLSGGGTAITTVSASDVYSPAVGFLKFDCLAGSDTSVSVPFHAAPRWTGRVDSAPSDLGNGVVRLALKDFPLFDNGELASTAHWLYCHDAVGAEGRHFRITAHNVGVVDISAAAVELGSLTTDDLVSIIPAWTLDLLFPPGSQTTFHPSAGPLAPQRASQLLLYDDATADINLASSRRFFVTQTAWYEVGSFAEAGDLVIPPGQAFLVRHPAGVNDTQFIAIQQVYQGVVSLPVRVANGKARDSMLAPPRPVEIVLDDLDFGPGQFLESSSTNPSDRKDELLLFDNDAKEFNKLPSAIYYRSSGQWLRDGSNAPSGSVAIEPSTGLLIRKSSVTSDSVLWWVNAPAYDVTAP